MADGLTEGIRPVPATLKTRLFFHSALAWFGTFFFLFGSIFPVVLGMQSDLTSVIHFRHTDPVVMGIVTDYRASGASSNKREILEYRYFYKVGNTAFEGRSFSGDSYVVAGQSVLVQYVPDSPALSRIQGMRARPFGWYVAVWAMVFPAIGFGMLYLNFRTFRKNLHLLTVGRLAKGSVTGKNATGMRINDRVVYQVFFKFKDAGGNEHEACVTTHRVEALGDERTEPLLYDPANPGQAALLDTLPAAIRRRLTGTPGGERP
ncbi:MAG: hypothetical protein H7176_06765 [Bdellovibrionales bacterium]|nr:hypothetical protein [Massilia sp.]